MSLAIELNQYQKHFLLFSDYQIFDARMKSIEFQPESSSPTVSFLIGTLYKKHTSS